LLYVIVGLLTPFLGVGLIAVYRAFVVHRFTASLRKEAAQAFQLIEQEVGGGWRLPKVFRQLPPGETSIRLPPVEHTLPAK
jgi:hypothetical protein